MQNYNYMSLQTSNEITENSTIQSRNYRISHHPNSNTASTSPTKNNKYFFSRTNSFDRTHYRTEGPNFTDPNKKSIYEIRYFLQVHKKKARNALITKNFEQSNLSPELCQNPNYKGMKGSKLQNKKGFRKNKYVEMQEVGCIQPAQSRQITNAGLIARHNKPNLMYNLDLFRKRHAQNEVNTQKKKSVDNFAWGDPLKSSHSFCRKKMRTIKTQQDNPKMRTLSQREYY